jgi:hypothetical protein
MVPIYITVRFSKPPEASIRAWRQCMRDAHAAQMRLWFDEMFPDHFTPQAKFKYGHKKRGEKYAAWKIAAASGQQVRTWGGTLASAVEAPGTIDNVLTGDMRDMLTKQQPQIRGFPTRGRLQLDSPDYLTMRPKPGSNQPDKWAELSRISADQHARLDKFLSDEVHKRFANAPQEPVTIRIAA